MTLMNKLNVSLIPNNVLTGRIITSDLQLTFLTTDLQQRLIANIYTET